MRKQAKEVGSHGPLRKQEGPRTCGETRIPVLFGSFLGPQPAGHGAVLDSVSPSMKWRSQDFCPITDTRGPLPLSPEMTTLYQFSK